MTFMTWCAIHVESALSLASFVSVWMEGRHRAAVFLKEPDLWNKPRGEPLFNVCFIDVKVVDSRRATRGGGSRHLWRARDCFCISEDGFDAHLSCLASMEHKALIMSKLTERTIEEGGVRETL